MLSWFFSRTEANQLSTMAPLTAGHLQGVFFESCGAARRILQGGITMNGVWGLQQKPIVRVLFFYIDVWALRCARPGTTVSERTRGRSKLASSCLATHLSVFGFV